MKMEISLIALKRAKQQKKITSQMNNEVHLIYKFIRTYLTKTENCNIGKH
jgi:hypothetical protein